MPETRAKHSKGPWRLDPADPLRILAGGEIIAAINDRRRLVIPGQAEADARLIASAPELRAQHDALVAALLTLRTRFHVALVASGTDPELADIACEEADAALAKAEGAE